MRHQEFRDKRLDAMQWYDEPIKEYTIPLNAIASDMWIGSLIRDVLAQFGHWLVWESLGYYTVTHAPIGFRVDHNFRSEACAIRCARELAAIPIQFYSIQDPAFEMTRKACREAMERAVNLDGAR